MPEDVNVLALPVAILTHPNVGERTAGRFDGVAQQFQKAPGGAKGITYAGGVPMDRGVPVALLRVERDTP